MPFKTAPLPGSFLVVGMLGFLLSVIYWKRLGGSWAFTFALLSVIFFAASLISLRKSVEHEDKIKKKRRK